MLKLILIFYMIDIFIAYRQYIFDDSIIIYNMLPFDYLENTENFEQIKETEMSKELSLSHNNRDKIFMQRRIKNAMKFDQPQSLKSKLTIPLELYESCNKMDVELSQFSEIAFSKSPFASSYSPFAVFFVGSNRFVI